MADTTVQRTAVEEHVRARLTEQYGQSFTSRKLVLRPGGIREFNAVSDDGRIVASIKAASGRTAGGKSPSGKIKSALADLYYLTLVDAAERLLVLTSPEFYDIFTSKIAGALGDGLRVECIPLPPDLQEAVDAVVRVASDEVSPTRRPTL